MQQSVSDRLYDHEWAALSVAGRRTGNAGSCSKAGGTDPESWFRGEICGSCATWIQNLHTGWNGTHPECSGETQEPERSRTSEIQSR